MFRLDYIIFFCFVFSRRKNNKGNCWEGMWGENELIINYFSIRKEGKKNFWSSLMMLNRKRFESVSGKHGILSSHLEWYENVMPINMDILKVFFFSSSSNLPFAKCVSEKKAHAVEENAKKMEMAKGSFIFIKRTLPGVLYLFTFFGVPHSLGTFFYLPQIKCHYFAGVFFCEM